MLVFLQQSTLSRTNQDTLEFSRTYIQINMLINQQNAILWQNSAARGIFQWRTFYMDSVIRVHAIFLVTILGEWDEASQEVTVQWWNQWHVWLCKYNWIVLSKWFGKWESLCCCSVCLACPYIHMPEIRIPQVWRIFWRREFFRKVLNNKKSVPILAGAFCLHWHDGWGMKIMILLRPGLAAEDSKIRLLLWLMRVAQDFCFPIVAILTLLRTSNRSVC